MFELFLLIMHWYASPERNKQAAWLPFLESLLINPPIPFDEMAKLEEVQKSVLCRSRRELSHEC